MKIITKPGDLYLSIMGKRIAITAIFDNDDEANEFMTLVDDQSVIANVGPFIFIAASSDLGTDEDEPECSLSPNNQHERAGGKCRFCGR